MMVVVHRFRWFGWFALCVGVILGCYLMSSRVAAERNRLAQVERSIATTQRDIKALETEFDTRASFAQLQRWNGETLKLSAPTAAQYVRTDAQLAMADFGASEGVQPRVQNAAVIPSSPVAPTPATTAPVASAPTAAPAPVKAAVAMVSAPVGARIQPASAKAAIKPKPATVALLDRKLLGDLDRGARTEASGR